MNIKQSNLIATKLNLQKNNIEGSNFNVNPHFYKKINKIEENTYQLILSLEIKNTTKNPFPIDISVDFETVFTITECDSEQEIIDFLNINAIQMIFPYMRNAVTSLTAASLMTPLVLPIIDVRQFKEKK